MHRSSSRSMQNKATVCNCESNCRLLKLNNAVNMCTSATPCATVIEDGILTQISLVATMITYLEVVIRVCSLRPCLQVFCLSTAQDDYLIIGKQGCTCGADIGNKGVDIRCRHWYHCYTLSLNADTRTTVSFYHCQLLLASHGVQYTKCSF